VLERYRETGERMTSLVALHGSVDVTLRDGVLRLPDGFRTPFAAGIVVTSWLDGCIALWPRSSWDALAARLMGLPIGNSDARAFIRLLLASATDIGAAIRSVPLSEPQRGSIGLGQDAVLVGVGDHAELWPRPRWVERAGHSLDDFAGALAG
jgi:MraZ protein